MPDAPTSQAAPGAGARRRCTACYLERDGFVLELLHFDREGNDPRRERSFTEPGLTHLSFSVDDIPATCALVTEHGGEVLADTDIGGLAIMVRDPDGQLLELLPMSYRTGDDSSCCVQAAPRRRTEADSLRTPSGSPYSPVATSAARGA